MNQTLIYRVKKGFKWSIFGNASGRFLQLLGDIILSRLLIPEDFGLMAIALSLVAIFEMLTETGFASVLIQKQKEISGLLNTAWTIEVLKGLLLFIIVFILAKPISIFYNSQETYSILIAISLLFLLKGFKNIGIIYFRKNLHIHKQVFLDLIPFVAQIMIVVPMAYYLQNVWAIVIGIYARKISELCLSYILHQYRPSFRIEKKALYELVDFGKWILLISIIAAIRKNFVPLYIGKIYNIEILGYFNRAELFSTFIYMMIVQIIWQVGYPVISMIHLNKIKLKKIYVNSMIFIACFSPAITISLFLISQDLVVLFLTEKWVHSVRLMQFLLPVAAVSLISSLNAIVLQSIGKPFLSMKISLLSLVLLLILIMPCSNYWGINGIIIALFLSSTVGLLYGWFMISSLIRISYTKFIYFISISLINCIFLYSILSFVKHTLFIAIGIFELIFILILTLILFAIIIFLWDKILKANLISLYFTR